MKISPAEGKVLDILWERGPVDAVQVVAALAESEGWGDPTVRTLLRRLIAKKAVAKEKAHGRPLYRALVARADVAQAESEALIGRFFEGRLSPLVMQFSERGQLTEDDVAVLRRLIEDIDHGR